METLRGIVERITYFDENSGFSILKIRCKGYSKLVTISGKYRQWKSHLASGNEKVMFLHINDTDNYIRVKNFD